MRTVMAMVPPELVAKMPQALGLIMATIVVYFLYRWFTIRMKFRKLRATGVPMMPHSFIFGHTGMFRHLPPTDTPLDAYGSYLQTRITRNWRTLFPDEKACPNVIYIDIWPLMIPFVLVIDPTVATHYMQTPSAPKFEMMQRFMYPLTKGLDIATTEGQVWKTWRSRFNPGFSPRNITTLIPIMLEEVQLYVDHMTNKAGANGTWGPVFKMEDYTTNLTFDVIGRAALGVHLEEQKGNSSGLRHALAETVSLMVFEINAYTVWKLISPINIYKKWKHRRLMDSILVPQIKKELRRTKDEGYGAQKTVLELALKNTKEEIAATEGKGGAEKIDQLFIDTVLAQLKIFLFAGHDTTATSLCWIYHDLSKNPQCLRLLREEHDNVFGTDPTTARAQLEANPAHINSLPYTLGVIKESLRLHPNVAAGRQGSKNITFTNVPGHENCVFPTDGMMIWDGLNAMHMRADLWPRPTEFLPERFLVPEGHELHPVKNAWRTFSVGPRNCIGQELAIMELKLAIVMMGRGFDVEEAWEEWDVEMGRKGGKAQVYNGERMYQVRGTTPHPKEGMPCHVRLRK